MIYKYRIKISTAFFLLLFIVGGKTFGETSCRDGWNSSSIGSRGACSHHGGVTSNIGLIFILSLIPAFGFYLFIHSSYRTYNNIIVSSKLPQHPLEKDLAETKSFTLYLIPTGKTKSRKDFTCTLCKKIFRYGSIYCYVQKGAKRIKYCIECSTKVASINEDIEKSRVEFNTLCLSQRDTIEQYYLQNSKGKMS